MKIQFEKQDAEKILYDSFCNGALSELYFCGIEVYWENNPNAMNYTNAKNRLKEKQKENETICIEDVYIEILKNGDAIISIGNSSVYGVFADKNHTIRTLCSQLSQQKNETISI